MEFTWIPFYREFANKLMDFRHNRKSLLDLIDKNRDALPVSYMHDQGGQGDPLTDVDPFTVIGMLNRNISFNKRIKTIQVLKDLLGLTSPVPDDFNGVPRLMNTNSLFFGFRGSRGEEDIENLWILFEKVIQDEKDEDIEEIFNKVIQQFSIKIKITMGLFWICPDRFLAFDSVNRAFVGKYFGIMLPENTPEYKLYQGIIASVREKMGSQGNVEHPFAELSANAHQDVKGSKDTSKDNSTDYRINLWKRRKNLVLQGAPGTGKTYQVPELVVRLCCPDAVWNSREELLARYNQLKNDRRVMFTTFHQSMDYEDWMEGLRPVVENNQVCYEIVPGIFKRLCDEAERPVPIRKEIGIADDAVIWKVSLAGTGENPIRKDCMENGYIRVGWDGYGESITDETDWSIHAGEGKTILNAFMNAMKVGDVVMSCFSSRTVDAVGVVTGDYEWHDEFHEYKRLRKVKWLVKGINADIVDMNDGKTMTLGTVYRLNGMNLDKVKKLLDQYEASKTLVENTKPYVVVIDELNRGNVAKIFGELITLLEPDKRKGMTSAESVVLPYSKKAFFVPDNVFVLATMNTADRSLGNMDYAIRRRFAFVTVRPRELEDPHFQTELFRKVSSLFVANYEDYADSGFDEGFQLERADTLCEEYRPEDVWIGHSYFLVADESEMNDRLRYEIIPLLEQYVRDGVLTEAAQETIDELSERAEN